MCVTRVSKVATLTPKTKIPLEGAAKNKIKLRLNGAAKNSLDPPPDYFF
jgi:hypothetical protein